jgi:hypothetical protein
LDGVPVLAAVKLGRQVRLGGHDDKLGAIKWTMVSKGQV